MTSLRQILIGSLFLCNILFAQNSNSKISADLSSVVPESSSSQFNFGVDLGLGNTSNAPKIPEGFRSSFQYIQPELLFSTDLTPSFAIIIEGSASALDYTNAIAAQNANSTSYNGSIAFTHFVGHSFEWGMEAGLQSFDGNEVDFIIGTDDGRASRFSVNTGYFYSLIGGEELNLELGAGAVNHDSLTETLNESGQIFEDDHDSYSFVGILNYSASPFWNLKLSGQFERKDYVNRQAYFSNGLAPDQTETNPVLSEETYGASIEGTYSVHKSNLILSLGSVTVNDVIFGGNDSSSITYSAKVKHEIIDGFSVGLETGVVQKNYNNFKADILTSSNPTLERVDTTNINVASLEYEWTSNVKSLLTYSEQGTKSSYSIAQIGETKWQTGLKINF